MIVVDEDFHSLHIRNMIASWYKGQVLSIRMLRQRTLVKDDAVPMLLLTVSKPTFVTLNVKDFWHRANPHPDYCIVALDLIQDRWLEAPLFLRRLLRMPAFRTKSARMNKVILMTSSYVEYYSTDRRDLRLDLPTWH